jgi:hypothetical protein
MSYGTIKVDTITFTDNSVDKSVSLSGLIQNPTFTGNITVTGTISGDVIRGGTTVSGATVTGTTANFVSGVFTTQISGATVTGTTASFTSGVFTNISGTTATITSGIIASGTAAAPSLAILADLDTGLFSPGANQLAVATNGTGRLFVNSNGDIGLGTSSPDPFARFYTRNIGLSSSGSTSLQINAATGSNAIIDLGVNSARTAGITSNVSETQFTTLTATPILVGTNGGERVRITSAGLVGVGTSSPGYKFEVDNTGGSTATARLIGNDQANVRLRIQNTGTSGRAYEIVGGLNGANNSHLSIYDATAAATRLTITETGLVGIGTSSPSNQLEIASSVGGIIRLTDTDGGYSLLEGGAGDIALQADPGNTQASSKIQFYVDNSEKARLDSSGRLGIGTTSPSTILHVASTAPYIRIQDTDSSTGVTAQGGFEMYDNDGDRLFYLANESSSSSDVSLFNMAGGALKFGASGSERGQFDSSGRLLVGTSTNITSQQIQSASTGGNNFGASRFTNGLGGCDILLTKSRGATVGTHTVVQSGDDLGNLYFGGSDGSSYVNAARISAAVDGTPGSNDMPGRLVFSTTADGAATPTARMTIKNNGNVGIGGSGIERILEIQSSTSNINYVRLRETSANTPTNGGSMLELFGTRSNGAPGFYGGIFGGRQNAASHNQGYLAFYVDAAGSDGTSIEEKARIDSGGRFSIGIIASPANQLQLSTDSAGKPSTNTWTIVSDERIKEEIELADLDLCYQAVKTIPLKRFKWKDEVYTEEQVRDRRKLGWIAQDVEAVFPKAVGTYEFKYNQVFEETIIPAVEEVLDDEGNVTTPAQPERIEKSELISEDVIEDCRDLNSDQLYAAMYGAIQKLMVKVETLEAEVALLKAQ